MNNTKQELHSLCLASIEQSITEVEAAIAERREAMHSETKSSMGDKYETTREMLQQDINMSMERLSKAKQDHATLQRVDTLSSQKIVNEGSLVLTNNGNFYLSVSAGKFKVGGQLYYAISITSPIGQQLKGKQQGNEFSLNGRNYKILEVQ